MSEKIYNVLTDKEKSLLEQEKSVLSQVKSFFIQAQKEEMVQNVENLIQHLDELFLLVVVGEVKSGKSSFVNALFGQKICKEGVTPITDKIHILRYGEQENIREIEPFVLEHQYPFEPLKTLQMVDTPGTNSLILEHQQITERFLPRADIVFFITSIDRPFTESERQFLSFIKDRWGKKIVFVLSKIDIKEQEEIDEVISFVKTNCKKLLNFEPLIFPVASKLAFASFSNKESEEWKKSRFDDLEKYIFETLSESERLKLKLSGPLFQSVKLLETFQQDENKVKDIVQYDQENLLEIRKTLEYEEKLLKKNYFLDIEKLKTIQPDIERWIKNFFEENLKTLQLLIMLKTRKKQIVHSDEDLMPIEKRMTETMSESLEHCYETAKTMQENLDKNLQKKLKSKCCLQGYTEEEKSLKFYDVRPKLQNYFHETISASILSQKASKVLEKTYSKLLILGGGSLLALLFSLSLSIIGDHLFIRMLGLIFLVGIGISLFKILPNQKAKAVQNFLKEFQNSFKELRQKTESLYDEFHEQSLEPLHNVIKVREKALSDKLSNIEQIKTQAEKLKATLQKFSIE